MRAEGRGREGAEGWRLRITRSAEALCFTVPTSQDMGRLKPNPFSVVRLSLTHRLRDSHHGAVGGADGRASYGAARSTDLWLHPARSGTGSAAAGLALRMLCPHFVPSEAFRFALAFLLAERSTDLLHGQLL